MTDDHDSDRLINKNDDEDDAYLPEVDESNDSECNLSPAVLALMKKCEPFIRSTLSQLIAVCHRLQRPAASQEDEKEPTCTKIYYASRTHSQLAQVLHELDKLKIRLNVAVSTVEEPQPPTSGSHKRSATTVEESDDLGEGCGPRAVSLGSRRQLCINEQLRARAGDLDEACRQMLGGARVICSTSHMFPLIHVSCSG